MKRRLALVGALVVMAAVGYGLFRYTARPQPPEIPADVTDPAIGKVLAAKRNAVLEAPLSATAWGELGMAFDAHHRWPQSQACYQQAMQLDPADARWPFLFAEQLNWRMKSESNKEEAVRLYRLAADCKPPNKEHTWTAALSLADLLTELGRDDEAAPLYERAFRAEPANPWAAYREAALLAERGQTQEAIRIYQTLGRSIYARKKAAGALAELYRRLGQTAEADTYERAADQLPRDMPWQNPYANGVAELRRGRAVLSDTFFAQERAQDAAAMLATANTLADQYPTVETWLLLLRALISSREYTAALAAADDVLRADPTAVTAHSYLGLARLGLADQAEAEGRKADADKLLAQAAEALAESVRLKPDYVPGYVYRAKALLRLGRLAEAEQAARAAVTARPEEWEAYTALADVLVARGHKSEAVSVAELAVKLAPPNEPRAKQTLAELKK